jgi:hypothetical protein
VENDVNLGDALSSFGASITSPAKLAFIGYVVLAYTDKISTSKWEFIAIAVILLALQVLHDDYGRICLNKLAERQAEKASRNMLGETRESPRNLTGSAKEG